MVIVLLVISVVASAGQHIIINFVYYRVGGIICACVLLVVCVRVAYTHCIQQDQE